MTKLMMMMMFASNLYGRRNRNALYLLLLFRVIISNAYELSFKPNVNIVHRRSGDSLVIACETVDSNGQRVRSLRPTRWISATGARLPTDASARVNVEQAGERLLLRFKNISVFDHGDWHCQSDNPPMSKSFTLKTKEAVSIQADSIEYAPLNQRFLVKCLVQSYADTKVRWKKGPKKLKISRNSQEYEITETGLLIKNVKVSDNDTFWCTAYTFKTGVMIDHPIKVVVSQPVTPPQITCENDPCAVVGKEAILYCHASGMPPARFQWTMGPDKHVHSSKDLKYHIEENRLMIKNFSSNDNGIYQCRAFNEYDREGKSDRIELKGQVPPSIHPILAATTTLNIPTVTPVEFICRVDSSASSPVTIRWLLGDNYTIVQPSSNMRIYDMSNEYYSKLRFNNPTKEDMGVYTCEVMNSAGRVTTSTNLKVRFRPEATNVAPSIFFAVDNHSAKLNCIFDGYPLPNVQWKDQHGSLLNEGTVSGAGFRVIKIERFPISKYRINSVLTVLTNFLSTVSFDYELPLICDTGGINSATKQVRLKRAKAPKKLIISDKADISRDRIRFSVSVPDDIDTLPIQHILVRSKIIQHQDDQFVPPFEMQRFNVSTNNASFPITLENLVPDKLYRISVVAHSVAGESLPYDNIFKTPGKTAPSFDLFKPDDLPFNSTNFSDVFKEEDLIFKPNDEKVFSCQHYDKCWIRWRIFSDGGDKISRVLISVFNLNAKSLQRSGKEIVFTAKPDYTGRYPLSDLLPISIYEVKVTVFNRVHLSSYKRFVVSTLRAPLGYQPVSSARNSVSVYRFLAVLFAVSFGLGVFCVAFPCLRASNLSKESKRKSHLHGFDGSNGNLDHHHHGDDLDVIKGNGFMFDRSNGSISAQSTFINHHNPLLHMNDLNNAATIISPTPTAPTFADGNVNPLYNENSHTSSSPWNVAAVTASSTPTNNTAELQTTFRSHNNHHDNHRFNSGFSRV